MSSFILHDSSRKTCSLIWFSLCFGVWWFFFFFSPLSLLACCNIIRFWLNYVEQQNWSSWIVVDYIETVGFILGALQSLRQEGNKLNWSNYFIVWMLICLLFLKRRLRYANHLHFAKKRRKPNFDSFSTIEYVTIWSELNRPRWFM